MTLDEVKPFVAEVMNRLPFVRWDRFVYSPASFFDESKGDDVWSLHVYGWIGRDDGRSDFIVLTWYDAWGWGVEECATLSSSADYDQQIHDAVRPSTVGEPPANPCMRVDEHFAGLVSNVCHAHTHA